MSLPCLILWVFSGLRCSADNSLHGCDEHQIAYGSEGTLAGDENSTCHDPDTAAFLQRERGTVTTPSTAAAASSDVAVCLGWCAKDTREWTRKCTFVGSCDGCSQCSTTPAPPTAAPTAPTPAPTAPTPAPTPQTQTPTALPTSVPPTEEPTEEPTPAPTVPLPTSRPTWAVFYNGSKTTDCILWTACHEADCDFPPGMFSREKGFTVTGSFDHRLPPNWGKYWSGELCFQKATYHSWNFTTPWGVTQTYTEKRGGTDRFWIIDACMATHEFEYYGGEGKTCDQKCSDSSKCSKYSVGRHH